MLMPQVYPHQRMIILLSDFVAPYHLLLSIVVMVFPSIVAMVLPVIHGLLSIFYSHYHAGMCYNSFISFLFLFCCLGIVF